MTVRICPALNGATPCQLPKGHRDNHKHTYPDGRTQTWPHRLTTGKAA